jgi:hypothetical protein
VSLVLANPVRVAVHEEHSPGELRARAAQLRGDTFRSTSTCEEIGEEDAASRNFVKTRKSDRSPTFPPRQDRSEIHASRTPIEQAFTDRRDKSNDSPRDDDARARHLHEMRVKK